MTATERTDDVAGEGAAALAALTELFCRSVRQLGRAGQPEAASRLAGSAWWVLHRAGASGQAEHVNGVMHFLAQLPGPEPTGGIPQ